MHTFLFVAIGGPIGASLRYFVYLFFKNYLLSNYLFLSTLFVNIVGSFLIGYVVMLMESKNLSTDFIKYFFIIGVLGSFTTFSTFSIESVDLILSKFFFHTFSYIFLSLSLCLLFTFIGLNFNKIIN